MQKYWIILHSISNCLKSMRENFNTYYNSYSILASIFKVFYISKYSAFLFFG